MQMSKQTAVEWLVKELNNLHPDLILSLKIWDDIDNLIDQAKQMEKEQIIDAHNKGIWPEPKVFDDGEDYYNETYEK